MLPPNISDDDAALGIQIISENYHTETCGTCKGTGRGYLFGIIPCACPDCINGTRSIYCGPANPFDPEILAWKRKGDQQAQMDKNFKETGSGATFPDCNLDAGHP